MILPCASFAEIDDLDFRNQMLDKEIENYTKIRDEKYEALKQCEKNTNGFKIAGITTLIATGVGVGVDIKLAKDLKKASQERTVSYLSNWSYVTGPEYTRWKPLDPEGFSMAYNYDVENSSDLNNGEWAITFTNGATVKGTSTCSTQSGDNRNHLWGGDDIEWALSSEDWSLSGDALTAGDYSKDTGTGKKYCWCKVTSVNTGSGYQSVVPTSWVFNANHTTSLGCAKNCTHFCVFDPLDYNGFRLALFGVLDAK